MWNQVKQLFSKLPPPGAIDAAIGVASGVGVLLRDGQVIAIMPPEAVDSIAHAIDERRVARSERP